jgi:glycosyl transferase family 25
MPTMWPYPIFVVNMKHHVERREAVAAQLARVGLTPTFIEAVNGREMSAADAALQDVEGRLRRAAKPLMPGEMGCYLSHWRIFETMVAGGIPQALVLEDDLIVADDLPAVLDALTGDDLPPYDLIKLAISETELSRSYDVIVDLTAESKLVRHHNVCNSTVAYVITLAGAKRFLGYGMPIRYPIDVAMNRSWRHGLDILGVRPWPVFHDHDFESVIGKERFRKEDELEDKGTLMQQLERRLRKGYDSIAKRADIRRRLKQDAVWKRRRVPAK